MEIIKFSDNKIEFTYEVVENTDIIIIGDRSGEKKIDMNIMKENICVNLYGIIIGNDDDKFELETITNHKAESSSSKVHIKSVLNYNSILNYVGMIKIEPKGQLTDAYLQNDNLLIGNDATANSSPQLEIQADDVKASHGVTISTINEYEKYYVKSRGLSDEISKAILIEGFINDILNKVDDKDTVRSMLKLPQYE